MFMDDDEWWFKWLELGLSLSLTTEAAAASTSIADASFTQRIRWFSLVRSLALSLAFALVSLSGTGCALFPDFLGGFGVVAAFLDLAGFFPSLRPLPLGF
jgi:hypothetical protein